MYQKVRESTLQSWSIVNNFFVYREELSETVKQQTQAHLDAFDVAQDAVSYMIVRIGTKNKIQAMCVVIEGDETNEALLKAGDGSVSIWKGHILITSEEALYYCDISKFLDDSEKMRL